MPETAQKELLEQLVKLAENKNAVIHGRKLTQISKTGAISYAKAIKSCHPMLTCQNTKASLQATGN